MSQPTIRKIAEAAGVSVAAVSYVLNGKKGVSEQTREKILALIKEMNYTPNLNSRRLILKRSFNIMVSLDTNVSTLTNSFYTEVLSAIVSRATELGYNIVLYSDKLSESNEALFHALDQKNADGVIFLRDISSELQSSMEKIGAPFVVVDSHRTNPNYPCVRSDNNLASYIATKHLLDLGHRRIAFIGMDRLPDFYVQTFLGYKRALSEASVPLHPDWIQPDAYDEYSAQQCMARILDCVETPTAVFCASDLYAIGAMNYLQQHGYQIPCDFSVCGIDNIPLSRYYYPALTTVHIDATKMGTRAIDVLIALINGDSSLPQECISSDQLIVRDSTKEPHWGKAISTFS